MQIVYAREPFPTEVRATIFLAGPTPRHEAVSSWRPEALRILEASGFSGHVFVPEPRDGVWTGNYDEQIEWEEEGLRRADSIVFWIPRRMSEMPGLTTNDEWGTWKDSGKAVFGAPDEAEHVRYQRTHAAKLAVPSFRTLPETLLAAVSSLTPGSLRKDGEAEVPLFIWRLESFQSWYRAQRTVGNRLDGARVCYTFRVGSQRSMTFLWILHVDVFIASEGRNKTNEFVLGRPDISTVLLWSRSLRQREDTELVLVREFRSPARTQDGMIHELPGGSSSTSKPPAVTALEEVREETGFVLDPARLKSHGVRQQVGTLSSFAAHLFSAELSEKEMETLKASVGQVRGVEESSERTFVEIRTVRDLFSNPNTDWATMGMILSVLEETGA